MAATADDRDTRPTLSEWLKRPNVQTVDSSVSLGWPDATVYSLQLIPLNELQPSPVRVDNCLVLQLQGATRLITDFRLEGSLNNFFPPQSLQVFPPGFEGQARWTAPVEVAFVLLSPAYLEQVGHDLLKGDPAHIVVQPRFGFFDAFLQQLVTVLVSELRNPAPLGNLFVESITQTLAIHLIRRYSNVMTQAMPGRATLTPVQCRQVETYIHEHLDQKMTLPELARLIHVSVSHFERMFRTTYHCAPYQYVLSRRLERARWLLAHTETSLFDVARQCGFADQSHFTKHFTRWAGVSPGRYARSRHA